MVHGYMNENMLLIFFFLLYHLVGCIKDEVEFVAECFHRVMAEGDTGLVPVLRLVSVMQKVTT